MRIDCKYMRIERAIRKFKAYGKELKQEVRNRQYYEKPSEKRNARNQRIKRINARRTEENRALQRNWKSHDRKLKKLRR